MIGGDQSAVFHRGSLVIVAVAILGACCVTQSAGGQMTGTFIDRSAQTDLRIFNFNVYADTIFPDTSAQQAAKFARLMSALKPDIVALEEIYTHTAAQTIALMDSLLPLGGGATWFAYHGSDNMIASRYPLSLARSNTSPSSPRGIAIALVDLPNDQYATDFYLMVNHYKCCGNPNGPEDQERQIQSDALVNWMRDARTAGGLVALASNTPMAVVGDLNIVGSQAPLNNLIVGNIVNQATYGASSPPDWNGSSLSDAHPLHNGIGPADYTWRDDQDVYAPGRLDYILYTDSVARVSNRFVLNTVDMSSAQLATTGMQQYDVTLNTLGNYDHLPLVADFRFVADGVPGDYNLDRTVDAADYQLWRQSYGSTTQLDADGNGDSVVDAADFVVWRINVSTVPQGAGVAIESSAVPEPALNLLLGVCYAAATTCGFPRSMRACRGRPRTQVASYWWTRLFS